jgi:PAS domain S-box-containing protein
VKPELLGQQIYNAQRRVEMMSRHTDELLLQPELMAVTLEELSVVLKELHQQHEALLVQHQTMESERQHYQELFELAPDGYLTTNVHGVIEEANQAAAVMLNVCQNFLVGKPLFVFIAQTDRKAFHTQLHELKQSLQLKHWELYFQPRQQQPFWGAIAASPIQDGHSVTVGLRWLIRDMSELKQTKMLCQ